MHFLHLIDCVLSLDLHVHGNKEGEEEENSTGESHQLRGRQLSVWPHPGLDFTILKMIKNDKKLSKNYQNHNWHHQRKILHRLVSILLSKVKVEEMPCSSHSYS